VKGKYCACGVVAELWITSINEQMGLFLVYIVKRQVKWLCNSIG